MAPPAERRSADSAAWIAVSCCRSLWSSTPPRGPASYDAKAAIHRARAEPDPPSPPVARSAHQVRLEVILKRRQGAVLQKHHLRHVLQELRPRLGRRRRRGCTHDEQLRADVYLSLPQASPQPIPARKTKFSTRSCPPARADASALRDRNHESYQRPRPKGKASERVRHKRRAGPSAARARIPVRAEKPPAANDPLIPSLSVSSELPVADQRLQPAAVRANHQLCLMAQVRELALAEDESGWSVHRSRACTGLRSARKGPASATLDSPLMQLAPSCRIVSAFSLAEADVSSVQTARFL